MHDTMSIFDNKTPHKLRQVAAKTPDVAVTNDLPVTPQRQGVVLLPGLSATSICLGVSVSLVDTTGLLASGSEATSFAVL
jgi:hypothetical protein